MSWMNATDAPSGEGGMNTTKRDCQESGARSAGDATMSTYRLIIDLYLVGVLCAAGWIGNALSVAVLRRDRRRSKHGTTNWLLQTLAMVDSAFMVTCILIQPLKTIYEQTEWGPSLFRRVNIQIKLINFDRPLLSLHRDEAVPLKTICMLLPR